jgi:hypothetical protein
MKTCLCDVTGMSPLVTGKQPGLSVTSSVPRLPATANQPRLPVTANRPRLSFTIKHRRLSATANQPRPSVAGKKRTTTKTIVGNGYYPADVDLVSSLSAMVNQSYYNP